MPASEWNILIQRWLGWMRDGATCLDSCNGGVCGGRRTNGCHWSLTRKMNSGTPVLSSVRVQLERLLLAAYGGIQSPAVRCNYSGLSSFFSSLSLSRFFSSLSISSIFFMFLDQTYPHYWLSLAKRSRRRHLRRSPAKCSTVCGLLMFTELLSLSSLNTETEYNTLLFVVFICRP